MKVLLCGATGFLGSHLLKALLNRKYTVFGTTRRGNTDRINDIVDDKNFTLIKVDLSDENEINKLPKDVDIVYHTVSQQPSSKKIFFQDYLKGNVLSTRNLFEYYQDQCLKLFVFSSTTVTLSQHSDIINETSEVIHPIHDYALTKLWGENLVCNYSNKVDFKCVILKYPSIYGKGQYGGIIYYYYDNAINNRDINVFCMGEPLRNVVHTSDVVKANLSVLDNHEKIDKFEIFLIGSKDSMKMVDIAQSMKRLLGSNSEIKLVDKKTFNNRDVILDVSKAKRLLDYRPLTVDDGLKAYIEEMGEINEDVHDSKTTFSKR